MVVNPTEDGWECIYQRAHAWMSYLMILDLKPELQTQEWPAVLQATLTHDHGWLEWDEALLDDQGRPASFVVSSVEKGIKLSQRGVDLAAHQSLKSAVFVARHIEELYGWRPEPELGEHVRHIRKTRKKWMRQLDLSHEHVEHGYRLVLWADTASLILCVEDQEFLANLDLVMGDTIYELRGSGENWRLAPWPYQVEEIRVNVETKRLNQKRFESADDLRAALAKAQTGLRNWTIRP
jgi:uncharacterized protein DUF3891